MEMFPSNDTESSPPDMMSRDLKRPSADPQYSSAALKMMRKMGYTDGQGLGKSGQGIVEPVAASLQRGRRGLGLVLQELEDGAVKWDQNKEHVEIEEDIRWMPEGPPPPPTQSDLSGWMIESDRKSTIDDETHFCDEEVLRGIMQCKSVFDRLGVSEMQRARTRSNPFETIRAGIFLNRAAMKMANMDAMLDFMFTSPKTPSGQPMVTNHELLYFADVCAGPGGFSEYVLWRKKWHAKGFGFTLKGPQDFKMEDFFAGPPETFETHYGVNGREGDGNVFLESNIVEFEKFVLQNTQNEGVHFMMADGGFSVEGQENLQEVLSKQLYLCQFTVALGIVRTGGHFVCKVFDLFTPFSVGLVYLMYRCFEKVSIVKPVTSRPANSERYVVCKWKRPHTADVHEYFLNINRRLTQLGQGSSVPSDKDVLEIVPLHILKEEEGFFDYIVESNNSLGEWQINGLAKTAAFCNDPDLVEFRQHEIKLQCLDLWKVPNEARKAPFFDNPQNRIACLQVAPDLLTSEGVLLTPSNMSDVVKSSYDWKFVLLGAAKETEAEDRGFFLGLGRSRVYQFRPGRKSAWEKINENQLKFELPAGTLLYGEVVRELKGEGRSSRRVTALHVIDALFLGDDDLRNMDVKTRNFYIRSFVEALNKQTRNDYVVLRAKNLFNLEMLPETIADFKLRYHKGSSSQHPQLTSDLRDSESSTRFFAPTGVMMFRIINEPYTMAWSKTQQKKYWFNKATGQKGFSELPPEAFVDFQKSFGTRSLWLWDDGVQIRGDQEVKMDENKLQASSFVDFIKGHC